jgi:cell division protein FtsW (lipid II flippase)
MKAVLEIAGHRGVQVAHLLGLAGLSLAGLTIVSAPGSAVAIQAGAFVIGGLILCLRLPGRGLRMPADVVAALCLAAMAAPLLVGPEVEGARRWLSLGPLLIQPAALVLPVFIVSLCMTGRGVTRVPLALAAAGVLAFQPDGAGLSALAFGLSALAAQRRDLAAGVAAVVSGALAIWILAHPDALPVVPHVERIAQTVMAQLPALGLAVRLGLFSLPLTFMIAAVRQRSAGGTAIALTGLWTGWVMANLVGNYPAPVLGYGASMVIGWAVSVALLDRSTATEAEAA